MNFVNLLLKILGPKAKRMFGSVVFVSLIMAAFDVLTIASIMPVLNISFMPDLRTSGFGPYDYMFDAYGIESREEMWVWAAVIAAAITIFSAFLRVWSVYMLASYSAAYLSVVSSNLMSSYLHLPYNKFIKKIPVHLVKNIVSEVDLVVNNVIFPLATIFSQAMITIALIVFLVVLSPVIALSVIVFFGVFYGVIFGFLKTLISRYSDGRLEYNEKRHSCAHETFTSLREIKLNGLENLYLGRFDALNKKFARYSLLAHVFSLAPRYLVEAVLILGVLLVVFFQMASEDFSSSTADSLPLLGVFAFGALRILPAVQALYAGVSQVRYGLPALELVADEISSRDCSQESLQQKLLNESFWESYDGIRFTGVSFCHPASNHMIFKNVDLRIPATGLIGIVGPSGAGKSTLLDLCSGLLAPTEGNVSVVFKDGTRGPIPSWGAKVGFVPQDFTILEKSIAENIAFGVEKAEIENDRVVDALKMVGLFDQVEKLSASIWTDLSGYKKAMSGGQLQRLAIARAIYSRPRILICDEITSALDKDSEDVIIDLLDSLRQTTQVLIVSHRLENLNICDFVVRVCQGRVERVLEREVKSWR